MIEIDGIKYYTLQDLQEKLGNLPATLRGFIKQGRLKAQKVGRRWLVSSNNLRDFLEGTTNAKQ